MEFTIGRAALSHNLNLLRAIATTGSTIPILSTVLVEANPDAVALTVSDLETGLRCVIPAKVKKAGAATIPARRLYDYIRLLPDADIHTKSEENFSVSLKCGRSKARIFGMSPDSFPRAPAMPDCIASIPLGSLAAMIDRTRFAISVEESRFTLRCALLIITAARLTMVATDGRRLSVAECKSDGNSREHRVLLPLKVVRELERQAGTEPAGTPVALARDGNHLFFQVGDRLLFAREVSGSFPDYERVFPKEQPLSALLDRQAALEAIARVERFSDERTRAIRVIVGPGEMKIQSTIPDVGESEETLSVEYEGPPIEMGYNASYLLDFLGSIPDEKVNFLFKDGVAAGEFRPAGEAGGYRYLIMPMRI